jgi:signal transduction histidine kinase/FixJ family two-component response regulator/type II secretory pathway pseudopilin PulG
MLGVFPLLIVIVSAAAVLIAGSMFFNIRQQTARIRQFESQREMANNAADQFQRGSDVLTYESKMFCETGDLSHFQAYITELTVTRNRDTAVQALFRMGLTQREISRIQDAKIASDDLSNREQRAMELVALSRGITETDFPEGVTADLLTEQEKNLPDEKKYALGYQYIMSADYFTAKNTIDNSVRKFSTDLMQRYGNATVEVADLGTATAMASFVIIVVLVVLSVAMSILYGRYEKENAAELAAAMQEARAASAAKSDFLSRMSHDIRTPLNGIIGMTALAKDEKDRDTVDRYLGKIDGSGHFLLTLVNDILDMSKIEAGKMQLHPEVYPKAEFERYLDDVIRPLCDMKKITFRYEIVGSDENSAVLTDKLRFNQIFFNLLSNAVKFTPEGGHVSLLTENMNVADGTLTGDFVVEDDGIGMSSEFMKKLFGTFEQESVSQGLTRTGSGLGLSITKSLVDLMGGTITAESTKGKGSRFKVHLSLPVVVPAGAEDKTAEGTAPQVASCDTDLTGLHILLAEDNDLNAEISDILLRKKGAAVDRAVNGEDALRLFSGSAVGGYDAILMDVQMPVMNGLEAAAAIRALDRADAAAVPIFAITANAYQDDIDRCMAAGMTEHLAKPVEPETMYRAVVRGIRQAHAGAAGRADAERKE